MRPSQRLALGFGLALSVLAARASAESEPREESKSAAARNDARASSAKSTWGTGADANGPYVGDDDEPTSLEVDLTNKEKLSREDIANKEEGGYVTGFPITNYDPNTGVGGGGAFFYHFNGKRKDPLFEYTPYLHRLFGVVFFTTKGLQFHTLDYDAPYIFGSEYRVRSALTFEKNISSNYFGIGEGSMGDLTYTGAGRTFSSRSEYEDSINKVQPGGVALSDYNRYIFERPSAFASVERNLLGGLVRPQLGFTLARVNVRDYTGRTVKAFDSAGNEVDAVMGPTKLSEDCRSGALLGCGGGWDNMLKVGIAYDTRDFEPDPNSGVFVDLAGELSSKVIGSSFDYGRITLSPRVYYSPFPKLADLVVAWRGMYATAFGDVPFYSMNTFSFMQRNADGLGGLRTMRGYAQDRFVGRVAVLSNIEVRWTFARFSALKQKFALQTGPFMDMGRVFDTIENTRLSGWKRTQGGQLKIIWNQATVIGVDAGFNREDHGIYFDFGHMY